MKPDVPNISIPQAENLSKPAGWRRQQQRLRPIQQQPGTLFYATPVSNPQPLATILILLSDQFNIQYLMFNISRGGTGMTDAPRGFQPTKELR